MRRIFYLLFLVLLGYSFDVKASDTVFIHETQIPVLIERQDNVLFYIRLDAKESKILDEVVLDFSKSTNLADVQAIKLPTSYSLRQKIRWSVSRYCHS